MPHEDATAGHTYPACAFNKVANEDFCRRTSAIPAHNHGGKCAECQCQWRRCSVCIVQREEGEPNPVKKPGSKLCAFHTEHGTHTRRANTKAVLVAKAGLPGWDLGLDVKLKLAASASVMPDEDLRRPVPPMTPEMRRLLNESADHVKGPGDLADVFRSEAFVVAQRQSVHANASHHQKDEDKEARMPASDMILDTDTASTSSKSKIDHSAQWAIIRALNEGEKIVIHGVAYSYEMKKIDDLLVRANIKAPASEIMWELFRKFDLLGLGSERKMRETLGRLYLVFLEEVREGAIEETDHHADNGEEERADSYGKPDETGGPDDDADEDPPAQAAGKAKDTTPRQPTEQKAMSDASKRALAARISNLTPKPRALANAIIAGTSLEELNKNYTSDKVAGIARASLFSSIGLGGRDLTVNEKIEAIQAAAPYVTAEPNASDKAKAAASGTKPNGKPPKAAKTKNAGRNGRAEDGGQNVPALAASAVPTELKPPGEGSNGHAFAYELPITIDLRCLGEFDNVDVQPTVLGLEHADERAKQIKKGRAAGFEPEHILMHPAMPAQFLFVKRS